MAGHSDVKAEQVKIDVIRPSVWRSASRNAALKVSAVEIARSEYRGCPPRVVRVVARQPSIASSEYHASGCPGPAGPP
jgi:hypothetical protein